MDEINANAIDKVPAPKRKYHSYDADFKREAVAFTKKVNNNRQAALKFGVDEKRIREWKLQEKALSEDRNSKRKRLIGGGRKPLSQEIEEKLLAIIMEMRGEKKRVTRRFIKTKAIELWSEDESRGVFLASPGWISNFLRRQNLTLRRVTTTGQKVPADCVQKIASFVTFIRHQREKILYDPSEIYGADETPLWVEPVGDTCIDKIGSKTVPIKTTGHDKVRYTVMLTASAAGKKCKPFLVLKRVRPLPALEKQFPQIIFAYSKNGWMDEPLTIEYLRKVFGGICFKRRLFVWDAYRCHKTDNVKKILHRMKIDTAMVPGGCTKYVQPADVSWNKPFKEMMRNFYDAYMTSGDLQYTKAGNPKAPPLEVYCAWVVKAWDSLSEEMIKHSFKACGISNAIDGSEDAMIHCMKPGEPCESAAALITQCRKGSGTMIQGLEEEDDEQQNVVNEMEEEINSDDDDEVVELQ